MPPTILLAGAGPGGLTAALALLAAGFEVHCWERAPELRTDGAGISLQINAMRVLAVLGVADELRARGAILETAEGTDDRDRAIQTMGFAVLAEKYGQWGIGIHRGELSRTLAAALPPDTVAFDRTVTDVESDDDGVTVHARDGSSIRVDALVGADGIHSAVRRAVFGDTPIRYAGYTCWRGIAPVVAPGGPTHSIERWGAGRRFGSVPIGERTTYWFATENAPADGSDGPDPKAECLERFRDFSPAVKTILEATPREAIIRNDIVDFAPLPTWTRGRVTLLGDAAHAMTPNLGQGACQAIEDAIVLAASIREHGIVDGLPRYEAERRPRTTQLVNDSRRFGSMAQLENGFLRWLRDRAFRLLASDRAVRSRLDALYGVPLPALRGDL
jgi:2-polyprenyl-6-methoxyphenol hydroxylase-like FAD-dependent oxidoreductase